MSFTDEQKQLIRDTVAKGAGDDQFKVFIYTCERTGLDPFARQIYFQLRKNSRTGESNMTILTGIDGYRLIADRTGAYAGNDDPVYDNEQSPYKATVTVYKMIAGVRCPFTASARWDQYYPGDHQGQMWRKMPHLMLGKCAEGLALRKAFPAELSGIYVKEEMDQAAKTDADDVSPYPDENYQPSPEPKKQPRGAPLKSAPQDPKEVHKGAVDAALEAGKAAAQKILDAEAAKKVYDHKNIEHQAGLGAVLEKDKIDPALWEEISEELHGKPRTNRSIKDAINNILAKH